MKKLKILSIVGLLLCCHSTMFSQGKCNFLCNSDFEDSTVTLPATLNFVDGDLVPCWKTTASDNKIEVWNSGCYGVKAFSGKQFIELNANEVSSLYQNFVAQPGTNIVIGFSHRGRAGVDEMSVSIGPVNGPYIVLDTVSTGKTNWKFYKFNYKIPLGTVTNYSLRFNSISAAGNDITVGNFLDNIVVELKRPEIRFDMTQDTCSIKKGKLVSKVIGGSQPYTYKWKNLSSTDSFLSNLKPGSYTLIVTDYNGCTDTSIGLVTDFLKKGTKNISVTSTDSCENSNKFSFKAIDTLCCWPKDFRWEISDGTFYNGISMSHSFSKGGLFNVKLITKLNGACPDTITRRIKVYSKPNVLLSFPNDMQCLKGNSFEVVSKQLDNGNDYTYKFNFGDNQLWETSRFHSYQSVGKYKVVAVAYDRYGCIDTFRLRNEVIQVIDASFTSNVISSCLKTNKFEFKPLESKNGLNYNMNWQKDNVFSGSDDEFVTSFNEPGKHKVTLICDTLGICGDTFDLFVYVDSNYNFAINADTVCWGESTYFSISPKSVLNQLSSINWVVDNNNYSGQGLTVKIPGNNVPITVKVKGANGCLDEVTFNKEVIHHPKPSFDIAYSVKFKTDSSQLFVFWPKGTDGDALANIKWDFNGVSLDNVKRPDWLVKTEGQFSIKLIGVNSFGCSDTMVKNLEIEFLKDVFIPNAFTPNGDGMNDVFFPKCLVEMKNFNMQIFNRWGELIFESNDSKLGWNGHYQGSPVMQDIYVFIVKLTVADKALHFSGTVTLLR
ncbi:MAG TPA: gliding motility-associated C-terminal domain-containing protein [Bacteroidia bacterium]